MKIHNLLIFYLVLFLAQTVSLQSQTNLVQNGNFETVGDDGKPAGWTYEGNNVTYSAVSDSYDGAKALQADVSSTMGGSNVNISQTIPVEIGETYTISFWYKVLRDPITPPAGAPAGGIVNLTGTLNAFSTLTPFNPDYNTPLPSGGDVWLPCTIEDVVIPDNAVSLKVLIAFNRQVMAVIDNVQVIKTSGEGPITKIEQSITGLSDITKTAGDPDFNLTATASSELPVSYSSSNTEVATIDGRTVHIVGAGQTTITASQAGNDYYEPAPEVTAVLTINPPPDTKQDQTISGLSDMTKTAVDADFALSAVASSGLPVIYSSSSTEVATIISGSTIHIVGAGTTTITASQAGNGAYNPAPEVTVTLTVTRLDQTITGLLQNITKNVGDVDFTFQLTASSGLLVSCTSSNTAVITIHNGTSAHIVGAGTATITASQAGNNRYNPAPEVTTVVTVNPARQDQNITGLSAITKTVGDPDFALTATASSGLAVSYGSSNTAVATVSGSTVHIVGAGTTIITASQAGNGAYNPAPNVTVLLTVNSASKQNQSITGLSDMTKTAGDADFALSAVASSGLAVSYGSSNTAVATVNGSTVHIVGAGTTIITASQAGNDAYNPAPNVTALLTVNSAPKQNQSITGLSAITKTVGDPDFALTATASSGLAVSYGSSDAAVATVNGSTVHIVGAGTTIITASQAGNGAYNPAPNVTALLTVQALSGIEEIKAQLPVRTENGNLLVTAAPGNRIEVFTVVGGRLQSVVSAGSETVLSGLPKGQVLIVRSEHAIAKAIL